MDPRLVVTLEHDLWWRLKARLKTGAVTLEQALDNPIAAGKPVVTIVALSRLAADEQHDQASTTATSACDAAGIGPATLTADLAPPRRTALLNHRSGLLRAPVRAR